MSFLGTEGISETLPSRAQHAVPLRREQIASYEEIGVPREKIAEGEAFAVHDFAVLYRDGTAEDGTGENESVEFAVFAAGIHSGWEVGEKGGREFPAREAVVEFFGIDADGYGTKAERAEFTSEFAGFAFPDRKKGMHVEAREVAFAVFAQVLEEDVTESDGADA